MPNVIDAPSVGLSVEGGAAIRVRVAEQGSVKLSVENAGGAPVPVYEGQTTVAPDEVGTVLPTSGYKLEEDVTVEPVDSSYVGSAISRKSSADLSVSGATVTAPAGYYQEAASKSVQSGSVTVPDRLISADPTISLNTADGIVNASVSASEIVSPTVAEGYVSSGAAGTMSVSGGAQLQLPTAPAQTINPSTSEQTAVAAGLYTTGAIKVAAMPSGVMGTPTATKGAVNNHSVDVTPSVSNQAGYINGGVVTGTPVSVSASELVSGSQTVTSNQTVDVTNLASVTVAVPAPDLQSKTATYTPSTSTQTDTITADDGKDGLSQVSVTVNPMPNATWRAGSTIDYSPTITVDANGLISADYTYNTTVKPISGNGYAESSHSYSVKTTGSATSQLSTQAAATITPTTSSQTAVAAGKYTTGAVTVDAMPAGSKGGSATTSVTQDASYKYYTTAWTNATNGYYAASAFNPAAQVRFTRQSETVTPSTTTQTITPTSAYYYLDKVVVNPIGAPNLQNKSKSYTPTETAQSESVSADAGYDGLGAVDVSVGAISATYIGSGVTQRSSADLSASGDTVTAPAGYYSNAASASVSGGSATPAASITGTSANVSIGTNAITLTKTVSNTPQVTAGYVSAGTAGNTSVSLTGTVPTQGAQTFHPSTTDQSVSGSRYLTAAQTFKGVTLSNLTADNIKNGVTVKIGDSTDDDCVASVTGTYSGGGGGSKNVQVASGVNRVATTAYTAVSGQTLTVAKTGTYDVYWSGYRSSTSGTNGSQLYIADTAYGSAQTTFSNNAQAVHLSNVSLTANQTIEVRARARSTSYYMYVANLTIVEA